MNKKSKNIIDLHSNFKAITTGKPQGGSISLDPKYFSAYPRTGKKIVKKETQKPGKQVKSPEDLSLDDWEKVGNHLKKLYEEDTKTFSQKDLDNDTIIKKQEKTTTKQETKKQSQRYKPITQKKEDNKQKPQVQNKQQPQVKQEQKPQVKATPKTGGQQKQQPSTQKQQQPKQQQQKPKIKAVSDTIIKRNQDNDTLSLRDSLRQTAQENKPKEKYKKQKIHRNSLKNLEEAITMGIKQGQEKAKEEAKKAKAFNDYFYGPVPKGTAEERVRINYKEPKETKSNVPQIGFLRENTLQSSPYEYRSKTGKEKYLEENHKNVAKAEEFKRKEEEKRKQEQAEALKRKEKYVEIVREGKEKYQMPTPLDLYSWRSLKDNPLDFTKDKNSKHLYTLIQETNQANKYLNYLLNSKKISKDEYNNQSLKILRNTFPLYKELFNKEALNSDAHLKKGIEYLHKLGEWGGSKHFNDYDGLSLHNYGLYPGLPNYNSEEDVEDLGERFFLPQFPYAYLPLTRKINQ